MSRRLFDEKGFRSRQPQPYLAPAIATAIGAGEPCPACTVPEGHPLVESMAALFGQDLNHAEVQRMVTALCVAYGLHGAGSERVDR